MKYFIFLSKDESSCIGLFSCRGLPDSSAYGSFIVGAGACKGDTSCGGSLGHTAIGLGSCQGAGSCAFLGGHTTIQQNACDGTSSCAGLYSSSIGKSVVAQLECFHLYH